MTQNIVHVTPENVKELLPKGYRMKVRHWHSGNDPHGFQRDDIKAIMQDDKGYRGEDVSLPAYATEAFITYKDPNSPNALPKRILTAFAIPLSEDQPRRRVGWVTAATRVYNQFIKVQNPAEEVEVAS